MVEGDGTDCDQCDHRGCVVPGSFVEINKMCNEGSNGHSPKLIGSESFK